MTPTPTFYRNRLRVIRFFRDMDQKTVASMLDMNASSISRYELGESKPIRAVVSRMCDMLGVPSDFFSREQIGFKFVGDKFFIDPSNTPPEEKVLPPDLSFNSALKEIGLRVGDVSFIDVEKFSTDSLFLYFNRQTKLYIEASKVQKQSMEVMASNIKNIKPGSYLSLDSFKETVILNNLKPFKYVGV